MFGVFGSDEGGRRAKRADKSTREARRRVEVREAHRQIYARSALLQVGVVQGAQWRVGSHELRLLCSDFQ